MVRFYQVGGSVRDEIMGVKSKDIDIAVEAVSYNAMRKAVVNKGCKIFLETPQYFTIRAHDPKYGPCDFVLCRKDGEYVDGRRPETVEAGTLYDDLARRDFTMNAMAKDDNGSIIDPFNGLVDIGHKVIRCVGEPSDRFNEDKLRILRAIRFAITKDMELDTSIEKYLLSPDSCEGLSQVSVERIREELLKAFQANTIRTLNMLHRFNLESLIFNENGLWLEPTLKIK